MIKITTALSSARVTLAVSFLHCLLLATGPRAEAQYVDYPVRDAVAKPIKLSEQKRWMIDVEIRGRTEDQTALNYVRGDNEIYELTRVRGGIRVHPAKWVSGYLQFHDTHGLNLAVTSTAASMRDSFDLRQGYLDLHYRPVQILIGRQELKIGDERVVGLSDWANNSRSWDGFDLKAGSKNRIEVFTTSVVAVHATSLDKHGAGLTFHGIVGQVTTLLPNTTIVPFMLIRRLPRVLSQQAVYGPENEVTTGLYITGKLTHGFEYAATGTLQRGSFSNDSIHAGSEIVKMGYTATSLPWTPRVQVEYDYATGNPHRNLKRIGTNDQIYPSNHNAFGLVDLFGFQNISQVRALLEMKPAKSVSILLQGGSLHLVEMRDALYTSSGGTLIKAPAAGFSSDDIGTEFDASTKFLLHKDLVTAIGVGHLFPGAVLTHNGHGAPLTLAYISFKYRFTLQ